MAAMDEKQLLEALNRCANKAQTIIECCLQDGLDHRRGCAGLATDIQLICDKARQDWLARNEKLQIMFPDQCRTAEDFKQLQKFYSDCRKEIFGL